VFIFSKEYEMHFFFLYPCAGERVMCDAVDSQEYLRRQSNARKSLLYDSSASPMLILSFLRQACPNLPDDQRSIIFAVKTLQRIILSMERLQTSLLRDEGNADNDIAWANLAIVLAELSTTVLLRNSGSLTVTVEKALNQFIGLSLLGYPPGYRAWNNEFTLSTNIRDDILFPATTTTTTKRKKSRHPLRKKAFDLVLALTSDNRLLASRALIILDITFLENYVIPANLFRQNGEEEEETIPSSDDTDKTWSAQDQGMFVGRRLALVALLQDHLYTLRSDDPSTPRWDFSGEMEEYLLSAAKATPPSEPLLWLDFQYSDSPTMDQRMHVDREGNPVEVHPFVFCFPATRLKALHCYSVMHKMPLPEWAKKQPNDQWARIPLTEKLFSEEVREVELLYENIFSYIENGSAVNDKFVEVFERKWNAEVITLSESLQQEVDDEIGAGNVNSVYIQSLLDVLKQMEKDFETEKQKQTGRKRSSSSPLRNRRFIESVEGYQLGVAVETSRSNYVKNNPWRAPPSSPASSSPPSLSLLEDKDSTIILEKSRRLQATEERLNAFFIRGPKQKRRPRPPALLDGVRTWSHPELPSLFKSAFKKVEKGGGEDTPFRIKIAYWGGEDYADEQLHSLKVWETDSGWKRGVRRSFDLSSASSRRLGRHWDYVGLFARGGSDNGNAAPRNVLWIFERIYDNNEGEQDKFVVHPVLLDDDATKGDLVTQFPPTFDFKVLSRLKSKYGLQFSLDKNRQPTGVPILLKDLVPKLFGANAHRLLEGLWVMEMLKHGMPLSSLPSFLKSPWLALFEKIPELGSFIRDEYAQWLAFLQSK
jgi:hypothetical protein